MTQPNDLVRISFHRCWSVTRLRWPQERKLPHSHELAPRGIRAWVKSVSEHNFDCLVSLKSFQKRLSLILFAVNALTDLRNLAVSTCRCLCRDQWCALDKEGKLTTDQADFCSDLCNSQWDYASGREQVLVVGKTCLQLPDRLSVGDLFDLGQRCAHEWGSSPTDLLPGLIAVPPKGGPNQSVYNCVYLRLNGLAATGGDCGSKGRRFKSPRSQNKPFKFYP